MHPHGTDDDAPAATPDDGFDDDTVIVVRAKPRRAARDEGADADTILRARRPTGSAPVASAQGPALTPSTTSTQAERGPDLGTRADPRWHRIRVNTHEPIALDAPALVGRRPAMPRIPSFPAPRLVRVPSPNHEVSGTHLELRQQGTSVVVTDLRSTNGTVVSNPGRHPVTLRQGESVVVSSGSVVDIGDGNTIEILPIPHSRGTSPSGDVLRASRAKGL